MCSSTENMVAFKSSRKGYDKSDVNRYIENMSIRFTESDKAQKERIKELEGRFSSLGCGAPGNAETEALKKENEDLQLRIKMLSEKLEESEKKIEDCKSESSEYKKYLEISGKIGSIIIQANADADRIVAEAEAEASSKVEEAEQTASRIRLDGIVSVRMMISKVKDKLIELTGDYVSKLKTVSEDSSSEYKKLYEELRKEFESLGKDKSI